MPLDKILFPKSGITKGDLLHYYEKAAKYMLPYMQDRPITMRRFPSGIDQTRFYQKRVPKYFPKWLDTVIVKKEGGTLEEVVCNSEEAILYLAGQAVISFHIWMSRQDKIDYPDKIVFDLDPSIDDFNVVIDAAILLRQVLEYQLDLKAYVMTTGSRGLHVVVPIIRKYAFDQVRAFVRNIAEYIADSHPDRFTTEIRKAKRKDRLFIDYLRNSYAQTSVAPYSVRARENAPVAMPLSWEELSKPGLTARSYTIKNAFKRLSQITDPWIDYHDMAQDLDNAMKIMDGISTTTDS
jgi:bifunctional non-homologous end joining protein LigD